MKRKTNIFYEQTSDSHFLTFDNYTESLTGDILAINQKLFPSRFLCVYLKSLDKDQVDDDTYNTNKSDLIKYLSAYYENKLAFLRDNLPKNGDTELRHPLSYLIMLLYYYAKVKDQNYNGSISDLEDDLINTPTTFANISNIIDFPHLGDVVEYDYNGTFADIICTISPSKRVKPTFNICDNTITSQNRIDKKEYKDADGNAYSTEHLYGWNSGELISNNTNDNTSAIKTYIEQTPIFDDAENHIYYTQNCITGIKLNEHHDSIKFNLIIPLFDSLEINNIITNDIDESNNETSSTIVLNDTSEQLDKGYTQKNIPLGIYFSDNTITLESEETGKYSSNWSLLISTQFKPFPYSLKIQNNEYSPDAIKDAYITFAEILSKQTKYVDMLNKYNELIIALQSKIIRLENTINNMGTVQNIDELWSKTSDLDSKIDSRYNELKARIDELNEFLDQSRIKWKIKNS